MKEKLKKEEEPFLIQNKLYFKKYKPIKLIGKGTFSNVYLSLNTEKKEYVAIKAEKRQKDGIQLLESEAYFLFSLRGIGIPEVISYGRTKSYNILVMPLLGKSLLDLFIIKNKNININDICLISKQILDRIEWVHSKNIIYRDIKPENFLFGRKDPEILYLIDFGLCRKYKSSKTGKHILPKNMGKFTGTSRYASVNSLAGNEQSRRDDIESIGYMIIFLMKKKLPWQGIKGNSYKECYTKLYLMKKHIKNEELCKGLPVEMIDFMKSAKSLKFEEEPNYNYLKNLFNIILKKNNFDLQKNIFSWVKKSNSYNSSKLNSFSKLKRKSSPYKRLYEKIKDNIEKQRKDLKLKQTDKTETDYSSSNTNQKMNFPHLNIENSYISINNIIHSNTSKDTKGSISELSHTMKVMYNKKINIDLNIKHGKMLKVNSENNIFYETLGLNEDQKNQFKKNYSPQIKINNNFNINNQLSEKRNIDIENFKNKYANKKIVNKKNKLKKIFIQINDSNSNNYYKKINTFPINPKNCIKKNFSYINKNNNNFKKNKIKQIDLIKKRNIRLKAKNNLFLNKININDIMTYNYLKAFNTFNPIEDKIENSYKNNIISHSEYTEPNNFEIKNRINPIIFKRNSYKLEYNNNNIKKRINTTNNKFINNSNIIKNDLFYKSFKRKINKDKNNLYEDEVSYNKKIILNNFNRRNNSVGKEGCNFSNYILDLNGNKQEIKSNDNIFNTKNNSINISSNKKNKLYNMNRINSNSYKGKSKINNINEIKNYNILSGNNSIYNLNEGKNINNQSEINYFNNLNGINNNLKIKDINLINNNKINNVNNIEIKEYNNKINNNFQNMNRNYSKKSFELNSVNISNKKGNNKYVEIDMMDKINKQFNYNSNINIFSKNINNKYLPNYNLYKNNSLNKEKSYKKLFIKKEIQQIRNNSLNNSNSFIINKFNVNNINKYKISSNSINSNSTLNINNNKDNFNFNKNNNIQNKFKQYKPFFNKIIPSRNNYTNSIKNIILENSINKFNKNNNYNNIKLGNRLKINNK